MEEATRGLRTHGAPGAAVAYLLPRDEAVLILVLVFHEPRGKLVLTMPFEVREHLFSSQLAVRVHVEFVEQIGLRRGQRDAHHFHIKVERRSARDVAPSPFLPVPEIRRDDERRLGALAQPNQTLVPAGDNLTNADPGVKHRAASRAVELLAGRASLGRRVDRSGIVHAELIARLDAVALLALCGPFILLDLPIESQEQREQRRAEAPPTRTPARTWSSSAACAAASRAARQIMRTAIPTLARTRRTTNCGQQWKLHR